MTFLLDTNVISELRKLRPHAGVLAWYAAHSPLAFALASITIYELQAGAEITRRQDADKAAQIDTWIETLLSETTVIEFSALAAREAARLMQKQSKSLIEDAMIAAIAKVNGLTIATRNTRDFERFRVPVVNPFTFRG